MSDEKSESLFETVDEQSPQEQNQQPLDLQIHFQSSSDKSKNEIPHAVLLTNEERKEQGKYKNYDDVDLTNRNHVDNFQKPQSNRSLSNSQQFDDNNTNSNRKQQQNIDDNVFSHLFTEHEAEDNYLSDIQVRDSQNNDNSFSNIEKKSDEKPKEEEKIVRKFNLLVENENSNEVENYTPNYSRNNEEEENNKNKLKKNNQNINLFEQKKEIQMKRREQRLKNERENSDDYKIIKKKKLEEEINSEVSYISNKGETSYAAHENSKNSTEERMANVMKNTERYNIFLKKSNKQNKNQNFNLSSSGNRGYETQSSSDEMKFKDNNNTNEENEVIRYENDSSSVQYLDNLNQISGNKKSKLNLIKDDEEEEENNQLKVDVVNSVKVENERKEINNQYNQKMKNLAAKITTELEKKDIRIQKENDLKKFEEEEEEKKKKMETIEEDKTEEEYEESLQNAQKLTTTTTQSPMLRKSMNQNERESFINEDDLRKSINEIDSLIDSDKKLSSKEPRKTLSETKLNLLLEKDKSKKPTKNEPEKKKGILDSNSIPKKQGLNGRQQMRKSIVQLAPLKEENENEKKITKEKSHKEIKEDIKRKIDDKLNKITTKEKKQEENNDISNISDIPPNTTQTQISSIKINTQTNNESNKRIETNNETNVDDYINDIPLPDDDDDFEIARPEDKRKTEEIPQEKKSIKKNSTKELKTDNKSKKEIKSKQSTKELKKETQSKQLKQTQSKTPSKSLPQNLKKKRFETQEDTSSSKVNDKFTPYVPTQTQTPKTKQKTKKTDISSTEEEEEIEIIKPKVTHTINSMPKQKRIKDVLNDSKNRVEIKALKENERFAKIFKQLNNEVIDQANEWYEIENDERNETVISKQGSAEEVFVDQYQSGRRVLRYSNRKGRKRTYPIWRRINYWDYSWGMTIDDFPELKQEEEDWEERFFDENEED